MCVNCGHTDGFIGAYNDAVYRISGSDLFFIFRVFGGERQCGRQRQRLRAFRQLRGRAVVGSGTYIHSDPKHKRIQPTPNIYVLFTPPSSSLKGLQIEVVNCSVM